MSSDNDDSPGNEDSEGQRYCLTYDADTDDSVSTVIITAVAAVTNTEPTHFGPLYDVVDPDAVNRLFSASSANTHCELSFSLNDCKITVSGEGLIKIELPPHER